MRLLIIWAVAIGIFLYSGTAFAQMCPMSKGKEKAGAECSKIISDCLGNKMVCPVMGTVFKADKDTKSCEYGGKTYYFCCPACVDKFKANAEKYIQGKEKPKSEPHHH